MIKWLIVLKLYIKSVTKDLMLFVCLVAPILIGLVFRLGVPFLEELLCDYFDKVEIIKPYYAIFDLIIVIMTPVMFVFSSILFMLEEYDFGIVKYYAVTPVQGKGYFFARIIVPSIIGFIYNFVLLLIFHVSSLDILNVFLFSLLGTIIGISTAMPVLAFAKNKLEGMALVKMSGLFIAGIPVVYFINEPIKYLFSFLPSFWFSKFSIDTNLWYFVFSLGLSLAFIIPLYYKYQRNILHD